MNKILIVCIIIIFGLGIWDLVLAKQTKEYLMVMSHKPSNQMFSMDRFSSMEECRRRRTERLHLLTMLETEAWITCEPRLITRL